MTEKLLVWLIFSVLLALVPILFDAVRGNLQGGSFGFTEALAGGELALVTAALCGAAVGELFGVGGAWKVLQTVSGGASVLVLLLCALFYAQVSGDLRRGVLLDKAAVRKYSCIFFLIGTVSSGLCVALSTVQGAH